jgi:hypothetical protein
MPEPCSLRFRLPTVTELRPATEPVTRDPFLDGLGPAERCAAAGLRVAASLRARLRSAGASAASDHGEPRGVPATAR